MKLLHVARVAAVTAVVGLVFWPVLGTPHVADDWAYLHFFRTHPEAESLGGLLWHGTGIGIFFRPLVELFFWSSHRLFGLSSLGYHVALLGLHAGSAGLVVFIAERLFPAISRANSAETPLAEEPPRTSLLAACVGVLYASSAVVLLQPLLWCVGIADIGGAFCVLLGLALYIGGRTRLGVLAFACALGFKESTIILPGIVLGYEISCRKQSGMIQWRAVASRLWPYAACVAVYLLVSDQSVDTAFRRGDAHPYGMGLGAHVLTNLLAYGGWGLQSILPLELWGDRQLLWGSIACAIPFSAAAALFISILRSRGRPLHSSFGFLGWWYFAALLPPLLLPNHLYRYYGIYALPPFLCAVAVVVRYAFLRVSRGLPVANRLGPVFLFAFLAMTTAVSALYVRQSVSGVERWPLADAAYLPARSRTVEMVRRELALQHPVLPPKATLVFDGVDLAAFKGERGIGVWYPDSVIRVLVAQDLRVDERGLRFRDEWYRSKRLPVPADPPYLDPRTTFFFRAKAGRLVEERL